MYNIPGLTSNRIQKFLNKICSNKKSYLEIGSFLGATGVSALDGNKLNAYFVDKWKEDIQSANGEIELPKTNKQTFIENIKKYKGENTISIFDCDLFEVDISLIKNIDVFFYDGPHDFYNTSKAVQYYSKTFSKDCILIFDDANFDGVVHGAKDGIQKSNLNIKYERILLTETPEDKNDLWNGLFIVLIN